MRNHVIAAFLVFAALWVRPAAAAESLGNASDLCDAETAARENSSPIPSHLLKAISLAETGRWDAAKQANVAWPWTVTALGQGNYFPDRASALDYVRRLKADGISNIDVGCMQINLYYHGGAFASASQAMDPAANIEYAADYLSGLYGSTRSWTQAAAYYHSTTPERARAYKLKVLKYWTRERRLAAASGGKTGGKTIDHVRMATLNKNRKQFREQASAPEVRSAQLTSWRAGGSGGLSMATLAAMRRAEVAAQWQKKYGHDADADADNFAAKRRRQLERWRLTRNPAG